MIEEFDTSEPILSEMPPDYFEQIMTEFIAAGRARSGSGASAFSSGFRAGARRVCD